jgi:hypothetical protein
MTAAERLAEIAAILAIGFQRLVVAERKPQLPRRNPQNPLDGMGVVEAACGSHALNPKSAEAAG